MAKYYVKAGTGANEDWKASTSYTLNTVIAPTDHDSSAAKYMYKCTTAGTSDSTEPTWDATVGNTTSDGTVTWTCIEPDSGDEALNDMQCAFDKAVGGDIVYCTGKQVLTSELVIDTNEGTTSTGYIRFIGCNSSWEVDGTQFIIEADSSSTIIQNVYNHAKSYYWFENFLFSKADVYGYYDKGCYTTFVNCSFSLNGGIGYYAYYGTAPFFINCEFKNNSDDGAKLTATSGSVFFGCLLESNKVGFYNYVNTTEVLLNCLIKNNTTSGIHTYKATKIINCVIDGNAIGIDSSGYVFWALCNRITNSTTGIDGGTYLGFCGWNYFAKNTSNTVDVTRIYNLAVKELPTNLTLSDGIDGTNETGTDDGYQDRDNDNFALKYNANMRNIEIELP